MIGLKDLLQALHYKKRFVALIAAILFAAIFGTALLLPRQYTASSSILIDLTNFDPAGGNGDTQGISPQVVDTVVGTQVDILRSSAVMADAAGKAGVTEKQDGKDDNEKLQRAIGKMRRPLTVGTDKGSNVVRLYYTMEDPDEAARRLDIIVSTFLAKQVALRTAPAQNNAEWYDQRTREVRERYEQAQKRLADFQRQNGIVGFDRMDMEADKVRSLSSALTQAQASAAQASSRAGSVNDPDVARAGVVQDLEREAGVQASKVADLSKTLGPNHPDMVAAKAQLAQLREALGSARSGQAQSLSSASTSARRQEAELRARLDQQEKQMIAMSAVQDQLMIMQRDVDAARQTYDTVRQRFNESTLRSEISQASASLLDKASTPVFPSKPNLALWFVAAVLIAGFGSVGSVALQEQLRPRVRTAEGTGTLTDMEVILDMTLPLRTSGNNSVQGDFA